MENIKLNLLDNGIDYIYESVRAMLEIDTNPEHIWKYSVLHLYSGIQLLLKEKLKQQHWTLICQDLRKVNFEKYKNGDFISVSHDDLVHRLKNISQVSFNDTPINNLQKLRNKIEHFEIDISLDEMQIIIIKALEEIINFWEKYFEDDSTDEQRNKFKIIKTVLIEFDFYREIKLNDFKEDMNEIKKSGNGLIVLCTNCLSVSFAVFKDDRIECKCFVCNETYKKDDYLKTIRSVEESEELIILSCEDSYDRTCSFCQKETRIRYKFPNEISLYWCLNCLDKENPHFYLIFDSMLTYMADRVLEKNRKLEKINQVVLNIFNKYK